jgi:hypothetical protein
MKDNPGKRLLRYYILNTSQLSGDDKDFFTELLRTIGGFIVFLAFFGLCMAFLSIVGR